MSANTEADAHELHRAQRTEIIFAPSTCTPEPQHVARTILRGEYESIVKNEIEGSKSVQKYLVATDVSGEAQHTLEWTIGTVLGAVNTPMAIYVIDQDTVEDGGKIFLDEMIAGELRN